MPIKEFKKILVTGGAGFLGLHMVEALIERGFYVRVIDNFMCSSRENLKPYSKKIDLVEGDIRESGDVKKAVKDMDAVFHFAAIRSVVKSVEDPLLAHEVNATGTLLLLNYAYEAKVKRFIFTSTSSVYGEATRKYQKENGDLKPISPYGMAKLLAEQYGKYFFKERRFPTTSVRIFNVYGPRQNPESKYSLVIPGVLSKIFKNESPVIDGTGEQARDFIFVDDILEAFFRILSSRRACGEVYNLGAGSTTSINTLVRMLLKLTGSGLKPVHGPRRPGDPDRTCADVAKARRDFGWTPRVGLEAGLKRVVEWYKNNG